MAKSEEHVDVKENPHAWMVTSNDCNSFNFYIPLDDNVPSYQANSKGNRYHRYKTDKLKDFQFMLNLLVKQLIKKHAFAGFPLMNDIRMDMYITPCNRKHGDRVNLMKGIEDALEGVLYKNDRQIKSGEPIILDPDKQHPSLQITISQHDY